MDLCIVLFQYYCLWLFGLVYCMFGSFVDVEDVFYDVWLCWYVQEIDWFDDLEVWLVMVIICFVLDCLCWVRIECEYYIGLWLFELMLMDVECFEVEVEWSEMLSLLFLLLFEWLSLEEWVVFLFIEVFDYCYVEVVVIFGIVEDVCWQCVYWVCM